LIDAGADVNALFPEGRFGAFALALDNKKMRIALQLLRRGAQPSFGDSDTLPLAVAEHGSLELLREIDARGGSNLTAFGARAAFVAARNKDPEVLDYLLSHGVELSAGNDLGYTPLILATVANHPSLVQRYVDCGDDLNARDIDGETALSLAIEKDLRRNVDWLGECALNSIEASLTAAIGHGLILQRTFTTLVTDGAVKRVIDQEELHHTLAAILDQR
jgi:ankyrin repeat protein